MTNTLIAQARVSEASSLFQDMRLMRISRFEILCAVIEEYRDRLPQGLRSTWLAALVLGLSLFALSGPP